MLTDKPLRDAIGAFGSSEPTPGGGSAAALAAAVGTALLVMVASLPKTRSGSDDDRTALGAAAAALTGIQQQLTEAIDGDMAAYNAVLASYRQPPAAAGARTARAAAVQRALRGATDVPLGVMRLSVDAVKQAQSVAAHGYRAAASDVGVALGLLQAGLEGARLNVRTNLGGLTDRDYAEAAQAESEKLAGQMSGLVRDAVAAMG
jgi:formiminotetrahydrofolate cyclodeaminase